MEVSILGIIVAALLSQNFILVKFYGICPFMGVSKKIDTALGMGMAVTFVMALASAACWLVHEFLLVPLDLAYMQTVAFILVIASIVQVVEMFLKKMVPALYKALGVFLPLITTNCAVLGVVLVNVQEGHDFAPSFCLDCKCLVYHWNPAMRMPNVKNPPTGMTICMAG